jgi:hypothetical protein
MSLNPILMVPMLVGPSGVSTVAEHSPYHYKVEAGKTKEGIIPVPLTSRLTGLESVV